MATSVPWRTSLEQARGDSRIDRKLILLHLVRPDCHSCDDVDDALASDAAVADCLRKNFVALRSAVDASRASATSFDDGVVIEDHEGRSWGAVAGHPDAQTLLAHMWVACLRHAVAADDFARAHPHVGEALLAASRCAELVPEALYLAAVVRRKCAHAGCGDERAPQAARELTRRFGDTSWARKWSA